MRGLPIVFFALGLLGQTPNAADIAAGAKTFRAHCGECHGLNGEGGRGPNLSTGDFFHGSSDAQLLFNISEGIPGTEMPGLFYSPDRVLQIVAYIRSLNQASTSAVKGDRSAGEALFGSAGCAQCHRVKGNGGRMGPDLTHIGNTRSAHHLRQAIVDPAADVRQRYWVVELTTDAGKTVSGFLMNEDTYNVQFIDLAGQLHSMEKSGLKTFSVQKTSKMPSFKDRFTQTQLDNLVAYLSSLRPAKGSNK